MRDRFFARNALLIASVAGSALVFGGCAKTQTVTQAQNDAAVCDALQNVVSQANSNFSSLKVGAGVADYGHTRWDTKPIFPGADCDVIGWGNGKTNYGCTWTRKNGEEAKSDYAYGVGVAKSCLGSAWTSSAIPGVTGEGLRFSTQGNTNVVDVRVAKELDPSQSWHTSLIIGAPVNRDAK
jgi:hypothetical protein